LKIIKDKGGGSETGVEALQVITSFSPGAITNPWKMFMLWQKALYLRNCWTPQIAQVRESLDQKVSKPEC